MNPKISIVTISYNSEETIEDTIKSVVSQSYDNLEYIIIDGGSKDGTLDIIKRYKDQIHQLVSEPDNGIYDAMNKGVSAATGDIVGILNSDDVYADQSVISDVVEAIGEADSLYADLVYVKRDQLDEVIRYWKSGEFSRSNFKKGWMPPHPTFFLRKNKYNSHGLYSTQLRSAADYELMLRMLYKNEISCVYLPKTITRMRVGGQSNVTLKNRWKANREDREAWRMNDVKPGLFTLIMKPLSKVKQWLVKS